MTRVLAVLFFLICFIGEMQAQNAQENFKFAKFNYDKKNYKESLGFLEKALKQDPKYINAYFLRSEVYFNLGQFYSTISDINQIFDLEKAATKFTGNYYLTRGKAFLSLSDYTNAADDFEKAATLLNENAELYYCKAKLEHSRGNDIDAFTFLDHAIDITSDNPNFMPSERK